MHYIGVALAYILFGSLTCYAVNDPYMRPSSSQQLAACLSFNGLPVAGEIVYYETRVTAGSGFHDHNAGRPKGSFFSPTGNTFGEARTGSDG